jgi:hypothetical protein
MKKIEARSRLRLDRETLRQLSATQLAQVAGGTLEDPAPSNGGGNTCIPPRGMSVLMCAFPMSEGPWACDI